MPELPIHLDALACAVAGSVPCRGCGYASGEWCEVDNGYVPTAIDRAAFRVTAKCNYCDDVALLVYNPATGTAGLAGGYTVGVPIIGMKGIPALDYGAAPTST